MTREEFYRFQRKPFSQKKTTYNGSISETDPSFAMTGQQMFMAAMRGEPIPGSNVSYYYSGVAPRDLTSADKAHPDKLDVLVELKNQESIIKQLNKTKINENEI